MTGDNNKWTEGPWFMVPTYRPEGFSIKTDADIDQPKYVGHEVACIEGQNRSADARLIAEAPALVEALEGSDELIVKAQAILTHYLVPQGLDAVGAVSELLELLDGPEQRVVQGKARAVLARARGEGGE